MSQRPKCSSTKVEKPKENMKKRKNRLTKGKIFSFCQYIFDLRARALRSLKMGVINDFGLYFSSFIIKLFPKN